MIFYPESALERAMKVQDVMLQAMAKKIIWWQAAEILGISDRHMRCWRERYEEFGFRGLFDRDSHFPTAAATTRSLPRMGNRTSSRATNIQFANDSSTRFCVDLTRDARRIQQTSVHLVSAAHWFGMTRQARIEAVQHDSRGPSDEVAMCAGDWRNLLRSVGGSRGHLRRCC